MKTLLAGILSFSLAYVSLAQSAPEATLPTGHTFMADATFKGSSLKGWHVVGGADWRANNGELTGTVKAGAAGGWLVLDKPLQDVAFHTMIECPEGGEVGIVLRMEKTDTGYKGVMMAITNGELGSYRVTFDPDGKELEREALNGTTDPLIRVASAKTTSTGPRGGRGGGGRRGGGRGGDLPLVRPDTSLRATNWNQLEIFLDANIIRAFLNDTGPLAVGVATDDAGRFGPVALYVTGAGDTHFKDLEYKDVSLRYMPEEKTSSRFRVQRISDMYYSWGVAAADFNRDGHMDVVAGPYIYFGPDFTTYREIFPANVFNPAKEFTDVNCQYAFDFNGDGWPDVLTGPPTATLYINPKGESRRWDKYVVVPSIQSEVTTLKDIDHSGVPALVYCSGGNVCYAKADPADPTKRWVQHAVSEGGSLGHGIGVGDINGDGRMDILNPNGWWEQPANLSDPGPWKFHPVAFGRYGHRASNAGGAVMGVYDVNGDGLNDVVCSLNAHGFGLAWFEQKRDAKGEITFVRHMISDDYGSDNAGGVTFSESHGSTFADVDGDGIPDFIVGKRYWSHLDDYFDPDPYGAPVLSRISQIDFAS